MSELKKRIFYFDEIRALAILLIILVHTSKWFASSQVPHTVLWALPFYLQYVGNLGVQLFLMISGALLLNRKYELSIFFKKRFSRVLIPFLFWISIIIIFKIIIMNHGSSIVDIENIVFFEGFVWFIWTILGLYLFVPVINSFIKQYQIQGCEFFLIFWIITSILNTIGLYPIKNIELRYFSGFLGYMVLGWYFSNKNFKHATDKSMILISILIFLISTITMFICAHNSILFEGRYKLSILPIIQASGIYLFIKYFADYSDKNIATFSHTCHKFLKNSIIGKLIISLSKCSYGIFLVHYFPIWILQIDNSFNIFSRNPFKWLLIIYLIILLFSWGLIWILSKSHYTKWISGT